MCIIAIIGQLSYKTSIQSPCAFHNHLYCVLCHYILVVSVVRQLNEHNMAICSLLIGGTRYAKRAIITAMLQCDG